MLRASEDCFLTGPTNLISLVEQCRCGLGSLDDRRSEKLHVLTVESEERRSCETACPEERLLLRDSRLAFGESDQHFASLLLSVGLDEDPPPLATTVCLFGVEVGTETV